MSDTGRGDIVETLLALEREKKTGVLDFNAEGVLTRVIVDQGIPVFAEAGVLGETLGNVLVREQIITEQQFAMVVRKMTDAIVDNENVRFGKVVVDLGILTEQALTNALGTQVEKKIIGCIWRGVGEWSFDSSRSLEDVAGHATPIRTLLVDAARLLPEQRVEELLRLSADTFPCTSEAASKITQDYGLVHAEVVALDQFDGTRTTQSILESGSFDVDWNALLCALVMGGSVELLAEKGKKTAPRSLMPIRTSGRHRAIRVKIAEDKTAEPVEVRPVSLRPAQNDREATLFSEDEFQSGKRLWSEGKLVEAHAQLVLACERSPQVPLYRLYEEFVASRVAQKFASPDVTKQRATRIVKEDAECAFAYYVLAYLALQEGDDSAKRLFKHAFALDPKLLDAGRQARILERKVGADRTASAAVRAIVPMRRAPAPDGKAKPSNVRLYVLLAVLAVVTLFTAGTLWAFLYGGYGYYYRLAPTATGAAPPSPVVEPSDASTNLAPPGDQ